MARINLTLRMRIFLSMILIILISFAFTGAFSFYHFKAENREYHKERLKRKRQSVTESIDYFLSKHALGPYTDSIVMMFSDKICELANINDLDVNIYSLRGQLLISSNPSLYDQRVLEDELSPFLLDALNNRSEPVLVTTKSDSIRYLSTYDYIHNDQHKPIAILNLPYFDVSETHRQDIQAFLIKLFWIYVLLFLVSIMVAYFLANYITGSLSAIGEKLKNVKINERNPPLPWKFNDEVGTLVDEYNRMLAELEKSAVKLAQTERESAWKEMAKQVAHEIKNPLTPMRLSVQHLARTLPTDRPEKLREFTEGMISQIDTLSNIASAFSRFANMPELQMRHFPARDILERVAALYPDTEIEFHCPDRDVQIYGDKDQLVRVMNNLINNSLQAVPQGRKPRIVIQLEKREDQILLSVADNGSGIPPGMGEQIFEPRFTTKSRGMGLGLAMVKNIVDSFGGSITYTSEAGEGTTFYIYLPLVRKVKTQANSAEV